jgi:putative DNA primase/helicase
MVRILFRREVQLQSDHHKARGTQPIMSATANAKATTKADVDRVVEIERLAALSGIDYEVARTDAAKQLSMRASALDREVEKKRRALGLKTEQQEEPGQGRAVTIADPPSWHEPVPGDYLAESLASAAKTYAVIPDEVADTFALWVMHTWLVNAFTISPRLAITSPTKGCGKTTLLRLLARVTRRGKRAGSISPAALFRVVEQFQPTILLDETEKYIEHGSDLHALLNEGHCKGGTVLRVLGEKLELRQFAVFGAVAFARNGRLPDDLQQRAIVIEMQRRLPGETLTELREGPCPSLERLAQQCARWADDNAEDVARRDPDMNDRINRDADNWRSLFAIADAIGSDWPARIRNAAAVLSTRESEAHGTMLLADIKAVFDAKDRDDKDEAKDRLWSEDMCESLAAMEGRPWAEWKANKRAVPKPLTKNQLARLLDPFGIKPDSVRIEERTKKGYHRHQFEKAWQRYLAGEGVSETEQRDNADEMGTSAAFQNGTDESDVPFQTCEKSNNGGLCSGVPVQKGEFSEATQDGHLPIGSKVCGFAPGQRCEHCGSGREVYIIQLPGEQGAAPRHKQCAVRYWGVHEKSEETRVCQHCGAPERLGEPVQECFVEGESYFLHRGCQADWLPEHERARARARAAWQAQREEN